MRKKFLELSTNSLESKTFRIYWWISVTNLTISVPNVSFCSSQFSMGFFKGSKRMFFEELSIKILFETANITKHRKVLQILLQNAYIYIFMYMYAMYIPNSPIFHFYFKPKKLERAGVLSQWQMGPKNFVLVYKRICFRLRANKILYLCFWSQNG